MEKLGIRRYKMKLSYNKLWKLLIDKGWTKTKLREKAKISSSSMAKLNNGGNITTDVLLKICSTLNCDISEIMEITEEKL